MGLLRLHLQPHAVNLLGLNSEALEELFAGLLVATETTETGAIRVLLAAIDAEVLLTPLGCSGFRVQAWRADFAQEHPSSKEGRR